LAVSETLLIAASHKVGRASRLSRPRSGHADARFRRRAGETPALRSRHPDHDYDEVLD